MSEIGATQSAIVVERVYRASVEELWELWTTKDGFESWWGPEGFRVEVHVMDARGGGKLEYDMIAATPEMIAAMEEMSQSASHNTRGWFDEYKPFTRLTLRHMIDFIDGVEPYESLIEVEFTPLGDQTRMVVTIHPHRDPYWTQMSAEGFRSQLTKLDRRFCFTGQ